MAAGMTLFTVAQGNHGDRGYSLPCYTRALSATRRGFPDQWSTCAWQAQMTNQYIMRSRIQPSSERRRAAGG